jgi:hypothetical protein
MILTLHRDLHHAHAQANMSKRQPPTLQAIFLFGTFPPPKKGGGVGKGRTARQGNEIITARRLLKIGFAPVDLLYSESLTKSTKRGGNFRIEKWVQHAPLRSPGADPNERKLPFSSSFGHSASVLRDSAVYCQN